MVFSLLMMGGAPVAQAFGEIRIEVNGQSVHSDVAPFIQNSRTMVPLRFVAEALGAKVEWAPNTRTVTVRYLEKVVVLPVDSTVAHVNGTTVVLNVPATIVNGRTFVPLRFVAEALGAIVLWNSEAYIVEIVGKGVGGNLPERFRPNPEPTESDVKNDTPDNEGFDRGADPITRAKFAVKALQNLGYEMEFSIIEGVAFILDSAIPVDVRDIIREEMFWTQEATTNVLGAPKVPVALFVMPSEIRNEVTRSFIGLPYAGTAGEGGIFASVWKSFVPGTEVGKSFRERYSNARNGFRFWLAHEYFHILQEYYREGGQIHWWVEGGADYVAWMALEKDYPRHHKEYWLQVMRSALQPAIPKLTREDGVSLYNFGFLVISEVIVGKDIKLFARFLEEISAYRTANVVEYGENPLKMWKMLFANFFDMTVEEAEITLSASRAKLIARMEREYGPWPWYLDN